MIPMNKSINGSPMNFALIGCGRIAQTYLSIITTIPECKLRAVVDIDEQISKRAANQYNCKAYSDFTQVLDENDIDAVIISTPPDTHSEIAMFFLENNIHVLCEKPFAINSDQAIQMVERADERGCFLMMASKFRYVDDVLKAKGIIQSGILGDIVLFENVFCSRVDMRGRWNSKKEISGGGVLIDNGSHSVDIVRFLLGPIREVQMEKGKMVQALDVEDTAHLYLRTEEEVLGTAQLSWSIHKEQESFMNIFGSEGFLSIGWKCSKFKQTESSQWVSFGKGYNKDAAFLANIKNFVATIEGREMPLITAIDGLESVKVIEAAYESSKLDKWVKIGLRPFRIVNTAGMRI